MPGNDTADVFLTPKTVSGVIKQDSDYFFVKVICFEQDGLPGLKQPAANNK